MNLTEEQKIILNDCNNGLFINATAGAGKSTLLSNIAEKLAPISNKILLLTFTNAAAKSIIAKCTNIDSSKIIGGTFHSISNTLMKQNDIYWNICDENKKRIIIKKLFNCKKNKEKLESYIDEISSAKCEYPLKLTEDITKYNNELAKYNLVDFDDMLYKFIDSDIILPKIDFCLVDESQDCSDTNLEMINKIVSITKCKIIAVGDMDQLIYSWRGVKDNSIYRIIDKHNLKIYNMSYNFRCPIKITNHARILIENNKNRLPKPIQSAKTEQGYISEYQCYDPIKEIDYVIQKIKQNPKEEVAVLYRNRTYKNQLEFELKKNNIKYSVNDSTELSDRSAIKVILSSMKLAAQIADIYDLEIASKGLSGIGTVTVSNIKKQINNRSLGETLNDLFHNEKNIKRLNSLISINSFFNNNENAKLTLLLKEIEKYLNISFNYSEDIKSFMNDICNDYLVSKQSIRDLSNDFGLDNRTENNDLDSNVILTTVHSFKGCQKSIIIVPWCQQFEPQPNKDYDIESERRLMYVAVSRASSKLYLCYSGTRPTFIKELKL